MPTQPSGARSAEAGSSAGEPEPSVAGSEPVDNPGSGDEREPSVESSGSANPGPRPRSEKAAAPEKAPAPTTQRARSKVRRAIDDAAEAVLEDESSWRWHALDPREAEETLGRIVAFVGSDSDRPPTDLDCGGVAALSLRLTELLRHQLLQDPRGLADPTLLDVLRRIEQCRIAVEPRSDQELAFLLTGANALELVVEFAHDLRSPLTSIMFLADTLRKGQSGEINDVQRDQLGIMYSAALGMVGLANDLMDLARSEVDDAWEHSTEEPFSLRELVEKTRNTVAPMAEQKRLDISFATPQHDVRIGHPVPLSRVLLNLLTNALKFTEQGRVEVVVQESPGERVLFSVSDTGRGIESEKLEALYNLFGRSESQTGYHFSGTGLGLSICRRLVELMGGRLQVESQRGKGSRFFFEIELPRAPSGG